MEKELIGCFVSGHPLDKYRKVIENCVTCTSENIEKCAASSKAEKESLKESGGSYWAMKDAGTSYIALGMLQNIHTIVTKKGAQMSFAKLTDFHGQIDLTFFPKTWESLKGKLQPDGIYAFKGKVDGSRDTPSLLVDSLEDIESLKTHSISSVHVQLKAGLDAKEINSLKDILFGVQGNCYVYFHIKENGKTYIVKANTQMTVPSSNEFVQDLKDKPVVEDVWCE